MLEKQERELVKALCDVRRAIEAQRTKIKEFVERLPSLIDRLSNELLLYIISLAIHTNTDLELSYTPYHDVHNWKTEALMKVSPHWRNTILHCPMLWNTIVVAPSWNKLQLKAHVERSWPSLVDIEICGWWITDSDLNLNELLDFAALCADRWHSVSILNTDFPRIAVLRSIRHLILPSLARFSVACIPAFLDENSDIFNPRFFTPGNSPFLQYLEIGGDFITSPGLPILPSLKELHIHLPPYTSGTSTTFLERLSLYPRLSTLTLSGDDQALQVLRPNGLQLPFLGKLICKLSNASSLLHAIVAPTLTHFE